MYGKNFCLRTLSREGDCLAKISTKEVSTVCTSVVKVGTVHILGVKVSTMYSYVGSKTKSSYCVYVGSKG